ncbi:Epimerase Family Protein Sdr39U1, partial [Manis pentadactyla]
MRAPWRVVLKGRWAVTKGTAYKHELKKPDSPCLPSTGAGRGHTDTSSSSLRPLRGHATSCTSLMEAPSRVGCERTASWINSLADSGCPPRFASRVSAEGRFLRAIWSSTTGREVRE